jgi:hypothetical protein
MPRWGEAARYPQDRLIGSLGRGDADAGAYRFAYELMEALLVPEGREWVLSGLRGPDVEELLRILEEVEPRTFRLGGGQDEGDDIVSFLVRFMGPEKSSAGELYLQLVDERWVLDELSLEDNPEGDISRFDYPSYERFF